MASKIKNVSVIGTGVIGAGWIIRCLAHNKNVIAYDKDLRLEKRLVAEIKLNLQKFQQKKLKMNLYQWPQ